MRIVVNRLIRDNSCVWFGCIVTQTDFICVSKELLTWMYNSISSVLYEKTKWCSNEAWEAIYFTLTIIRGSPRFSLSEFVFILWSAAILLIIIDQKSVGNINAQLDDHWMDDDNYTKYLHIWILTLPCSIIQLEII